MKSQYEADKVGAIYSHRFDEIEKLRNGVWQVLAKAYFQKWIRPTDSVLDLGAGYCEFINNIDAKEKIALDLNPNTKSRAASGIRVLSQDVCRRWSIDSDTLDVVFSSNFFEHLHSKDELQHCLEESYRVLRGGGQMIVMGPNIRFCYDVYWDFFDHHLPLSDRSVVEALELVGFTAEHAVPRFLPYTMAGKRPPAQIFVRMYLSMPIFWRLMGKQFLIVARKGIKKYAT